MNEAKKFYKRARQSAKNHMKNGQIHDYLNDLLIVNHYKRILEASRSDRTGCDESPPSVNLLKTRIRPENLRYNDPTFSLTILKQAGQHSWQRQ